MSQQSCHLIYNLYIIVDPSVNLVNSETKSVSLTSRSATLLPLLSDRSNIDDFNECYCILLEYTLLYATSCYQNVRYCRVTNIDDAIRIHTGQTHPISMLTKYPHPLPRTMKSFTPLELGWRRNPATFETKKEKSNKEPKTIQPV